MTTNAHLAPVVLIVTVDILPNRIADFLNAIEAVAIGSRRLEPYCNRFDVFFDKTDPHRFYLFEVYVDKRAFAFHKSTPHYKHWADFRQSGGVEAINVDKAGRHLPTNAQLYAFRVERPMEGLRMACIW